MLYLFRKFLVFQLVLCSNSLKQKTIIYLWKLYSHVYNASIYSCSRYSSTLRSRARATGVHGWKIYLSFLSKFRFKLIGKLLTALDGEWIDTIASVGSAYQISDNLTMTLQLDDLSVHANTWQSYRRIASWRPVVQLLKTRRRIRKCVAYCVLCCILPWQLKNLLSLELLTCGILIACSNKIN